MERRKFLKTVSYTVAGGIGFNLFNESKKREIVFGHVWNGGGAMARSKTRKLLFHPDAKSLFFDLEKDPYEMENLYDHPNYQDEIAQFKEAINEWQGNAKLGDNFLDYNAPQINQPNVPPLDGSHREKIISYYQKKMEK